MATVAAFFTLLWVTVFLVDMNPDRAFLLSLLTFAIVGLGILYTTSSLRREREREE